MKSLPFGSDDLVTGKRNERAKQVEEADQIYTWLIRQRGLVRDLIHAAAARVTDPAEASKVRLDLYLIVRHLAAAAASGSPNAIWQNYKHHFVSDRNRAEFFTKLRRLARREASKWCL